MAGTIKKRFGYCRLSAQWKTLRRGIFLRTAISGEGIEGITYLTQRRNPKIQDLVKLGKLTGLPSHLLAYCERLTHAYVFSRYPDMDRPSNFKKISSDFLLQAAEVIEWAEKQQ